MSNLPFPSNISLKETLRDQYLLNSLRWLGDFKDSNSSQLLGTKLGSPWSVGYTARCLIEAQELFVGENGFPSRFEIRIHKSIDFLLEEAISLDGLYNWEGIIWDTAIIVRSLLYYVSSNLQMTGNKTVFVVCAKAIKWLCIQLRNWDAERYTLGMIELSQSLRTLIFAQNIIPQCFKNIIDSDLYNSILSDIAFIIPMLLSEFLNSVEKQEIIVGIQEETIMEWDNDIFATAETIIGLSKYLSVSNSALQTDEKRKVMDVIRYALRYLEIEQSEGRWGIESVTALCLRAYILGYSVLGDVRLQPKPYIVFKALRFLCDYRVTFSDGSIAHEIEPTIYYALALLETIKNWELPKEISKKPLIELYDFVLWNTPSRDSLERSLRMKAESENTKLEDNIRLLSKEKENSKQKFLLLLTFLFICAWIIIGMLFSILLDTFTIDLEFVPRILSSDAFIGFSVAWIGFGYFIWKFLNIRIKQE
jgi:hypothetical protein